MAPPPPRPPGRLFFFGRSSSVWGGLGAFWRPPRVGPPAVIAGLVVGFGLAIRRIPWLGVAVRTLSVRWILAVHLLRFLGFYFLWLQARGRLPLEFAQRAGWGDVAAAAGALVLLCLPDGPASARALQIWNWFGIADLAVAVGTAGWLNASRPGSVQELAVLPLALVPLWLVPLLMTSHLELLARRRRPPAPNSGAGYSSPVT